MENEHFLFVCLSVLMKGICTVNSGADISALCVCLFLWNSTTLLSEVLYCLLYFCYFFMPYVHNKFTVADPCNIIANICIYFIVKYVTFVAWVQIFESAHSMNLTDSLWNTFYMEMEWNKLTIQSEVSHTRYYVSPFPPVSLLWETASK